MPKGIYLTPEQKEQIVALYKTGLTQCEVAERFGVSQNTVSRVVHPSGYDRTHIGSQIARSIPVANVEPRKGPSEPVQRETAKNPFRVTSRTLKLHSEATGHTYTVSTETDVVDVESDNALMREWLTKVNGTNPQAKAFCGFQPVYLADADIMQIVLEESQDADYFDILYTSTEVEVYCMCILRKDGYIRFYDIRYIAALVGYESWLISAGLIAVNRDFQLKPHLKRGKLALAKAIYDIWGIDIRISKIGA